MIGSLPQVLQRGIVRYFKVLLLYLFVIIRLSIHCGADFSSMVTS